MKQHVLDSGSIPDSWIADVTIKDELRHHCPQSLHKVAALWDDLVGSYQ